MHSDARSASLARALVRLYPRVWRERYAPEMFALLEQTGLGWRRALNLLFAAGREWFGGGRLSRADHPGSRVVLMLVGVSALAVAVTTLASGTALLLRDLIDTPPRIWREAGDVLVAPPWFPGGLALLGPFMTFLTLGRWIAAFVRQRSLVTAVEFRWWVAGWFVASACWQWDRLVNNLGTGLPLTSIQSAWSSSAPQVWSSLLFLFLSTGTIRNDMERQRILGETAKRLRLDRISKHPLGLGPAS